MPELAGGALRRGLGVTGAAFGLGRGLGFGRRGLIGGGLIGSRLIGRRGLICRLGRRCIRLGVGVARRGRLGGRLCIRFGVALGFLWLGRGGKLLGAAMGLLAVPRRGLAIGVGGHRRDQRRAAACRPGIDWDRLRGGGRRGQQVRRLGERRLQAGREEGRTGFARARGLAGGGGGHGVVLVALRPLVFAAAHVVAQVRRR